MTTLQADEKSLVPEFKSNDPYGWLSGDDSYQLPPEWIGRNREGKDSRL